MLSSPRNPPSNALFPARSLRFTYHVKLSSSLWKARSSHSMSASPRAFARRCVKIVDQACTGGLTSPKFHSYAGSCPVQILLDEHQIQLFLAKVFVHQREREHVEGQVPRRIPRVFPLVRHRDDVGVVHVMPLLVAGGVAAPGPERGGAPLLQPPVDVVVVELLGPEHPRERLAHHIG